MSEGINRVQVMGNLGRDPELRQGSVLKLAVAATERYRDKQSGEWTERVEWIPLAVFGKQAEGLSRMLRKGSRIYAEGRLQTSTWEQDGQKRYRTEVVAFKVLLLDKPERQEQRPAPMPEPKPERDFDSDLPF